METKIRTTKKEIVRKDYIVRNNGYSKNFFNSKEKAMEELKRIKEKYPLAYTCIRVEYTYYQNIFIEEEPF